MIKLERPQRPASLDDLTVSALTAEFKATKKAVWNRADIKEGLLKMSFNKCCYCEAHLLEESKYMEVEHYYHKDAYNDKVVEWENLLPSCKRCNVKKGTHDVSIAPIINPASHQPRDHITLLDFMIRGKDDLGKETIKSLSLNDPDRLTLKRYKIGIAIHQSIEELLTDLEEFDPSKHKTSHKKNRLYGTIQRILSECTKASEFSACAATVLVTDPDFSKVNQLLISHKIWDGQLQALLDEAISIALV